MATVKKSTAGSMYRFVFVVLSSWLAAQAAQSGAQAAALVIGGISQDASEAWDQGGYSPVSLKKQIVEFSRSLSPGSILVSTSERKLYFVLADHKAIAYPVGVGREGFSWSGANVITKKAEWPDWRPPQTMVKREAERGHFLPELVKGGPQNPLGARALYIGDTEYRIHGTSAPWSIGHASSSGCIRMLNEHIVELYQQAQIGAKVIVE